MVIDADIKTSVLVTGAEGFVGRHLCDELLKNKIALTKIVRSNEESGAGNLQTGRTVVIKDIGPDTDWSEAFSQKVDTIIHLAGRAHVMQETAQNPLNEYLRVNTYGTEKLAITASNAGVRRFVFISSIGVNGNYSGANSFSEEDTPKPHNEYSQSKYEAEKILHDIAEKSNMETIIIRPPLIYGAGVKANFKKLIEIVEKGMPLPLASICNRRSFIGLRNMVDFLLHTIHHPNAGNRLFLLSDGEDLSTPELIIRIAARLQRKPRLFPFPENLLRLLLHCSGKKALSNKLLESLLVDSSRAQDEIGWQPPYSVDEELDLTMQSYLAAQHK